MPRPRKTLKTDVHGNQVHLTTYLCPGCCKYKLRNSNNFGADSSNKTDKLDCYCYECRREKTEIWKYRHG